MVDLDKLGALWLLIELVKSWLTFRLPLIRDEALEISRATALYLALGKLLVERKIKLDKGKMIIDMKQLSKELKNIFFYLSLEKMKRKGTIKIKYSEDWKGISLYKFTEKGKREARRFLKEFIQPCYIS
ncbi:MAG: hypothetical protein ACTSYM_05820 [Candidatus Baldrarchaeia archaeon]